MSRVISAVLSLKDKNFTSNAKKATGALTDTERKAKHAQNSLKKFGSSAVSSMKNIAKNVGIAGAAIGAAGGAMFAATKKVTDSFDDIAKSSTKLGVTTDAYQELDYWAGQNGISTQTMERAVGRLNQRIGRAADGNEKYASALENLNVDMDKVRDGTITTEDALGQSIKSLSEMESETEKSAAASELFGTKMARDLMPALQDGSLSLEEATEKANELGIVIDEETLKSAEKFNDSWDDLRRGITVFGQKAIAGMMPFFQGVIDWATDKMPIVQGAVSEGFSKIGSVVEWVREKGETAFNAVKNVVQDNEPSLNSLKDVAKDAGSVITAAFEKAEPVVDWFAEEGIPKAVGVVSDLIDKGKGFYDFVVKYWPLIKPVVLGITGTIVAYKLAIMGVSAVTRTWRAITTVMTVAQTAFNVVLNANPIGIITLAIVGLVTAGITLYKNWDTVKEKAIELWNNMDWLRGVVFNLLGPFGKVVEAGIYVYKNWDTIKEKASDMGSYVKGKVVDLKDNVVNWFGELKDGAVEKFEDIVQSAKDLPGKIGQGIKDYAKDAWEGITGLANDLVDKFKESLGIKSPSAVFFDMAKWIVKGLVNGLSAENLLSLGKNMFKGFAGGAINTISSIKDFFTGGKKPSFDWGITSPFGMRTHPITGEKRLHGGVDFGAPHGAPIPSTTDGVVSFAGSAGGFGNLVKVQMGEWEMYYAHMSKMLKRAGDTVKKGDILGEVGATGQATGPHLHYETRKNGVRVDPMGAFERGGRVTRSGSYLVGERGPEMVDLPSGAKVHNHQNTKNIKEGGIKVIIENIIAKGVTTREVVDEIVTEIELRLANM